MSLSLTGRKRKDTFTWLLQAQGAGPLDPTTPRVICLGDGTPTPLSVTSTGVFVGGNSVVTSNLTINGHALTSNIELTADDIGASAAYASWRTYYIDGGNGNDTTGLVGRWDRPYKTLLCAFNAAVTAGVNLACSFEFIAPGDYYLTVTGSDTTTFHFIGPSEDTCHVTLVVYGGNSAGVSGGPGVVVVAGNDGPKLSCFARGVKLNVSSLGGLGHTSTYNLSAPYDLISTVLSGNDGLPGAVSLEGGYCSGLVCRASNGGLSCSFTRVRFTGGTYNVTGSAGSITTFQGCDLVATNGMFGYNPIDLGGNYWEAMNTLIGSVLSTLLPSLQPVSSSAYPVIGGMYVTTDTCNFYDPTTRPDGSALQAGDSYLVLVQGNNSSGATQYNVAIFSDITMAPSIYPLYRTYDGSAWGSVHSADNTPILIQPTIPANFTLSQKHNGKIVRVAASSTTITLPNSSWTGPFNCRIIYEGTPTTSNYLTFGTGGNTVHSKNSYKKCKVQYGEMFVTRKETGVWQISGDLTDL